MSDAKQTHVENLRRLVDAHGGQSALVGAINKHLQHDEKPLEASQVSNCLHGRRPFGEKLRRKIERALGIVEFWFEVSHPDDDHGLRVRNSVDEFHPGRLSAEGIEFAKLYERCPAPKRDSLFRVTRVFVESAIDEMLSETAPARDATSRQRKPADVTEE